MKTSMRKHFRPYQVLNTLLSALFFAIIFSSCGGGGGGGGAGAPAPVGQGLTFTGNTTKAQVTSANAEKVASEVLAFGQDPFGSSAV